MKRSVASVAILLWTIAPAGAQETANPPPAEAAIRASAPAYVAAFN